MGGNSLIMIKLVHHLIVTKSAADFESLVDLLESLGLQKNFISREGKESGLAIFPAPPQIQINVEHGANSRSNAAKLALGLSVSNPDTVYEIVKKKGFKIIADSSKPGPGISSRRFDVLLPNATRLRIFWMENIRKRNRQPARGLGRQPWGVSGRRFGLVVSRFNSFITERLLAGALDALLRSGALHGAYNIVRVPGAFEIPSAARMLAETKIYDAIICLDASSAATPPITTSSSMKSTRDRTIGAGNGYSARLRRAHLRHTRTGDRPRWIEDGQQRFRSRTGRDRDGKPKASFQWPVASGQKKARADSSSLCSSE